MFEQGVVGVVGAGIAGLTVAHELERRGIRAQVYEARDEPGGVIRSVRKDGFLIEYGPNSIQPPPEVESLIKRVGLASEVVEANSVQSNRFVVRRGMLLPVPLGPRDFFRSSLFSWKAKARLLLEPFIRPSAHAETVAEFVRRRVGAEFLDYAIDPFVAGVFAGDPERLSMRHAFPRMVEIETQYGSLVRGMMTRRKVEDGRARKRLLSFANGLQTLPSGLAQQLQTAVQFGQPVRLVEHKEDGWSITRSDSPPIRVDALVSTIPVHRLLGILRVPPAEIPHVTYAPVTVVALGYGRQQITHPLNGFGLLVPQVERRFRILGALFSSTLFPDRAPHGHVLITTFLGGMRHQNAPYLGEDDAIAVAHHDLTQLLSVEGLPVFSHVVAWPKAIPQYEPDYDRTLRAFEQLEQSQPGLFLTGNFRGGISVVDTIASATAVADRVVAYLAELPTRSPRSD